MVVNEAFDSMLAYFHTVIQNDDAGVEIFAQ